MSTKIPSAIDDDPTDPADPMTQAAVALLGPLGAMICASKSAYWRRYPRHLVVFNANICTSRGKKIWFGDLDVTRSRNELRRLARRLQQRIHVLWERDARFDSARTPRLADAAYATDGTTEEFEEPRYAGIEPTSP